MFQLVRGCSFVLRCCRFPCFMKEEKSLNQVLGLQTPVKPLANQNKKKRKEKNEKNEKSYNCFQVYILFLASYR